MFEPIRSGGMDWAANWLRLVEERRVFIEARRGQPRGGDFWDQRAERFAHRSEVFDASTDRLAQMLVQALGDRGTLLDVGAGAGRYAIPLARVARRVTAVEPSRGMRSYLEAAVSRAGLTNVAVVPSTWEEAKVDPHDVVLASNVVYPIAEIVPFLEKLDRHSRRGCYIAVRVDEMAAELAPLWKELWGDAPPREPGFLDLYNLLFSMGIRPHAQLTGRPRAFPTLEDAVAFAREQMFLPAENHDYDERIRGFLSDTLIPRNGALDWSAPFGSAIVWWEKA